MTTTSSPPKSQVYTRTGDKGTTSLFTGTRVAKTSPYFDALGSVDELNSLIGVAKEFCLQQSVPYSLREQLEEIQSRLFDIGSHVATPKSLANERQLERCAFSDSHVLDLEKWIDEMDAELPPLKNFILPGGGIAAAQLHTCRSVARRAERSIVSLVIDGDADASVLHYLNRVSDYFFVAARFASHTLKQPEVVWRKPRVPSSSASAAAASSSSVDQ